MTKHRPRCFQPSTWRHFDTAQTIIALLGAKPWNQNAVLPVVGNWDEPPDTTCLQSTKSETSDDDMDNEMSPVVWCFCYLTWKSYTCFWKAFNVQIASKISFTAPPKAPLDPLSWPNFDSKQLASRKRNITTPMQLHLWAPHGKLQAKQKCGFKMVFESLGCCFFCKVTEKKKIYKNNCQRSLHSKGDGQWKIMLLTNSEEIRWKATCHLVEQSSSNLYVAPWLSNRRKAQMFSDVRCEKWIPQHPNNTWSCHVWYICILSWAKFVPQGSGNDMKVMLAELHGETALRLKNESKVPRF